MKISSHGVDDCSRRANGMLLLMDKFATYFGLELSVLIFSMIEQLSTNLQAIQTNVDDSFMAVDLCIKPLKDFEQTSSLKTFMILYYEWHPKFLVILLFFLDKSKCLEDWIVEHLDIALVLWKNIIGKNILKRLTLSTERFIEDFIKKTFYL